VVLPGCRGTALVGYRGHRAWPHNTVHQDTACNLAIERQPLRGDRPYLGPLRGDLESDVGAERDPEDAEALDVLRLTQKIAGTEGVADQGMQRRLPGTLAEAGVVKPEHRTASPTEEFDIIEMRRQIARRAGTKQDDRGLSLWRACGYWLSNWRKPKPTQRPSLGVGEDDRLRIEPEVRGYLVAIPIREEDHGVEQAVQHWNRRA